MSYPHELGARGACHGSDVEAYFPNWGVFDTHNKMAIKICGTCEVQAECLEWALHHERHGIWGGTTPSQRADIRAKRNIIVDERWNRAS